MQRFIGLDAHGQSCTLCVMGPTGRRLATYVVETQAQALIEQIGRIAGELHVCMEEGAHSEWLYELLEPHVHRLVVIQPTDSRGNKSDEKDSWGLCERLRLHATERTVFKAPGKLTELRQATRGYIAVQRDRVRAKNRLRALYRSRGLQPTSEIYEPETRPPWLQQLPPAHRQLAVLMGAQLDALTPVFETAEKWLLEEGQRTPITRRLQTVPGIGPIRAAQLAAVVISPQRFRSSRQFWSYSGLAVVTRSSSDWVRDQGRWVRKSTAQTRGLTRHRQPLLKAVFKGAAITVIQHLPKHPLTLDFVRMTEAGTRPSLARLTIARRIAAIVLAMWKHQEDYDPAKHSRRPAA